jgi:hypothetical protein
MRTVAAPDSAVTVLATIERRKRPTMTDSKPIRRRSARKAAPRRGLHIRPYTTGWGFAVWNGEEQGNVFATMTEAERALAHWQARVEAGRGIDWHDCAEISDPAVLMPASQARAGRRREQCRGSLMPKA